MKGVSNWVWIAGGVIAGLIIFSIAYSQIAQLNLARIEKRSLESYDQIRGIINDLCWNSPGNSRIYPAYWAETIDGVYTAQTKYTDYSKEELVDKIVSKENSIGKFICIKMKDKRLRCEELECDASMPFMGSVPTEFSLSALINKIKGESEVFTYWISLNRTVTMVIINFSEPSKTTTTIVETTSQACASCLPCGNWSACANGNQDRKCYKCGIETGYQCQEYIENRTCLPIFIVALKSNLKKVYSDSQMSSLKNKIDEYVQALSQDGLDPKFLYLDEDETKNLIGFKVTEPGNYLNIDSALDQLINKLGIKYIVIVGGYDRFPQAPVRGTMETWAETDDKYADVTGDNDPEISVGRVIDPNDGDIDLLLKSFDTFTSLHKSGGLDISKPIISTPSSACGPSRTERCLTGECFSKNILGDSCPSSKCIHDSRFYNTVSNNFLYYVEHGSPSVPQSYDSFTSNNVASATFSNNLLFTAPCWGGNIKDYSKTSDSIPMTFFKNGGAVFLGSTDPNCCALSYTGSCSTDIDEWGVGALYYQIAKKMSAGKRIGDAYREGKSEYLKSANLIYFPKTSQAGINCLYGDPTLKINKMW